jgi:hypothetical protein
VQERTGVVSKLTPAIAARLAELRASGASKAAMLRALAAAGSPLNWRTLTRYLDRSEPAQGAAAVEPAALERRAADALEGDDLAHLTRVRDDLDAALATWRPLLGRDGAAVRAYATLARIHADVTARLVELRPRPEAEAERMTELGTAARGELLTRAVDAATADEVAELRERVEAQAVALRRALDAMAGDGE